MSQFGCGKFLLIAGLVGLGLAGCGEQQAPEAKGKLNVALIIPTTGELSSYGRQCRKGAELAWKEIDIARAAGGEVGFWLNIRDDHADSDAAARTAVQLYDVAHYLAVIGPVAVDSADSVARTLVKKKINTHLVVPTVEAEGLREGHNTIVQLCLTSSAQGRLLATFVAEQLKPATPLVLLVTRAEDAEAAVAARAFEAEMTGRGGAIKVEPVTIEADTADTADGVQMLNLVGAAPKTVVDLVREKKPGAVVAAVGDDRMGALIKALREAGETVPLVGGTHAYGRAALAPVGLKTGDVFVAAHFAADEDRPQVRDFVASFKRDNGGAVPGAAAALTYDAVKLVDAALRRAMPPQPEKSAGRRRPNLPEPAAVGEALRDGTVLTDAVTGPITVKPDGSVTKPLFILRLDEVGARFHARVEP